VFICVHLWFFSAASSQFGLDTRPGGGIMPATMVRNDTEHQRGHGTQWTDNPGTQQFDQKHNPMLTVLRKLTVAWPLAILLLLPALTRAETAVQAWVQRYDSGSAKAVALDANNEVIVTGSPATIKYSSGGVPLWTNLYNGGSAYALAVDSNNDVSVTGSSATIKYSSGGLPLWTNLYTGGTAYALAGWTAATT
jgi:hypothetical protein